MRVTIITKEAKMAVGDKLRKAIELLGPSARACEQALVKRRIRGVPGHSCRCLLAGFLSRACNAKVDVGIFAGQAIVAAFDAQRLRDVRMPLPEHLKRLIVDFDSYSLDSRLYPSLVKWTPPIAGWQYPVEVIVGAPYAPYFCEVPDYLGCPVRISMSFTDSNRGHGWRVMWRGNGGGLFPRIEDGLVWLRYLGAKV